MHWPEIRAPCLDIDLADFVRRIPWQYKYRNGDTKYILKKTLESRIPHDILYRFKKGFGIPVAKWFREDSLSRNADRILPFLNVSFSQKKYQEHIEGSRITVYFFGIIGCSETG